MPQNDHVTFHLARADAERAAAVKAACAQTRDLHTELAERHADRAWSLGEGFGEAGDVSVNA